MPLDWSQCSAVESVPGRLNGAWVFRDTRLPVSVVFENLEAGSFRLYEQISVGQSVPSSGSCLDDDMAYEIG